MASLTLTTPATFPLFTELPLELQIEIFSLAAAGTKETTHMLDVIIIWTSDDFPNNNSKNPLFQWLVKYGLGHGYWTRTRMLKVCRLSRLVALEEWKKELSGINIQPGKNEYIGQYMEDSRAKARAKLLAEIEVLIGVVRGGDLDGQ